MNFELIVTTQEYDTFETGDNRDTQIGIYDTYTEAEKDLKILCLAHYYYEQVEANYKLGPSKAKKANEPIFNKLSTYEWYTRPFKEYGSPEVTLSKGNKFSLTWFGWGTTFHGYSIRPFAQTKEVDWVEGYLKSEKLIPT